MKRLTTNTIIESLHFDDRMFRTLKGIEPLRKSDGRFRLTSGRHSVVFEALWEGGHYGIKCYTWPQPLLAEVCDTLSLLPQEFIIRPTPYAQELWVGDRYVDVVLYPWVEGHSLDREIRRAIHNRDREAFGQLLEEFCRLALAILSSEWRHGDMKCENIIVRPDGTMALIDFDALYSPGLEWRGEVGTPLFVHPERGDAYDSHIDDYAIALITCSLAALHLSPSLATGEGMVALPSEHKRGEIAALFGPSPALLRLLDSLYLNDYKIDNLEELLLCIIHKLPAPTKGPF